MTGITIPPEALEAGARAVEARINQPGQCSYHDIARAAFLAIVDAWPGMAAYSAGMNGPYPYIILPLPPTGETSDD